MKDKLKRILIFTAVALVFFALGMFSADFLIKKEGNILGRYITSFKNPSGPPRIVGPSGPPPAPASLQ